MGCTPAHYLGGLPGMFWSDFEKSWGVLQTIHCCSMGMIYGGVLQTINPIDKEW